MVTRSTVDLPNTPWPTPGYVGHLPSAVAFEDIAPILCAGVTVYKGIRMTDTRPGQWIAVSEIGHLGHVAVQYAIAMGLRVVAIDISADKLALARELGAALTFNASECDAGAAIQTEIGGTHGVLVTAVSRSAFAQALGMVRRGGTIVLNGLPPGDFPLPIFSTVLNGITVRGSIVGTRKDLQQSLEFAAQGHVRARIHLDRLDNINHVLAELKNGNVDGRIVLKLD